MERDPTRRGIAAAIGAATAAAALRSAKAIAANQFGIDDTPIPALEAQIGATAPVFSPVNSLVSLIGFPSPFSIVIGDRRSRLLVGRRLLRIRRAPAYRQPP